MKRALDIIALLETRSVFFRAMCQLHRYVCIVVYNPLIISATVMR